MVLLVRKTFRNDDAVFTTGMIFRLSFSPKEEGNHLPLCVDNTKEGSGSAPLGFGISYYDYSVFLAFFFLPFLLEHVATGTFDA